MNVRGIIATLSWSGFFCHVVLTTSFSTYVPCLHCLHRLKSKETIFNEIHCINSLFVEAKDRVTVKSQYWPLFSKYPFGKVSKTCRNMFLKVATISRDPYTILIVAFLVDKVPRLFDRSACNFPF